MIDDPYFCNQLLASYPRWQERAEGDSQSEGRCGGGGEEEDPSSQFQLDLSLICVFNEAGIEGILALVSALRRNVFSCSLKKVHPHPLRPPQICLCNQLFLALVSMSVLKKNNNNNNNNRVF
ncbi:UNVERIFIED_CONTAM: hypothetical protein K2H54_034689 [Gekko kuhli]